MKNVTNLLSKTILVVLGIILLWIIYMGLLEYDTIVFSYNPFIVMMGIALYICVITIFYNKVIPKIENNKILPYVLCTLFTIICLAVAQTLKVNPSWDMGEIYKIAEHCATEGGMESSYLYQFSNNIGIAIVYSVLFKFFEIINITDFLTIATVFNAIIVSISIILLYLVTKKIFGNRKALMVLIISLLTTPFYLYSAIYYTDTLSMFMMLLIAFIYLKMKDINKEKKFKIAFGWIVLGITIFIGIKIKITTGFIVIAYIIYKLLKCDIKNTCKEIAYIIPTIIILTIIYNSILNIILPNKEYIDNEKIPIEHWIMMGLYENGGYHQEDYEYTQQFATYQEKKEATISKIKERLSNYDANSFLKHINAKLKYAWTDGTYLSSEKVRREPVNSNILHEFVLSSGKYSSYYKYVPQVMHMSMLIFILIGLVKNLKNKDFENKNILFYILMFGFMAFLLIWENRSRYLLTVVPYLMMLQLEGIEILSEKVKERR